MGSALLQRIPIIRTLTRIHTPATRTCIRIALIHTLTMRRTLMHTRISDIGAAIPDDTAVITAAAITLAIRTEPIGAGTDIEVDTDIAVVMDTAAATDIGADLREAMDTGAVMLRIRGLEAAALLEDTQAVTWVDAAAGEAEGRLSGLAVLRLAQV